jgi:ABC-type oligopeptide transport system ATPase subunit
MENIKILEITLIVIILFILYRRKYSKKKIIRSTVAKYINVINKILSSDKNGISAMEYNDRYTIIFNMGELTDIGMVRLLKGEKKLIILDEIMELTDKEYENLLETIKPVL